MNDSEILHKYGAVPIDYSSLLLEYSSYASPKDKIEALVNKGTLLRLKRGLYLISPIITGASVNKGIIANHLCGPSYVSLHTALAYYSMIPEQVFAIQSVTTKKARSFDTSFGRFEYYKVAPEYYSVGITLPANTAEGSYYVATPEKALCDLLYFERGVRIQSKKAMREFLFEDMRVDFSALPGFDKSIVEELIALNKKAHTLELLLEVVKSEFTS